MPSELPVTVVTFAAVALVTTAILAARAHYLRSLATARLAALDAAVEEPVADLGNRPFVRRHPLAPVIVGAVVGLGLHYGLGLAGIFAFAFFAIVAVIGGVADRMRVEAAHAKIENQLADAIDLMIGALRAGSGLLDAFEAATVEAEHPLQEQLREVSGKIRLGDDARKVLSDLVLRVPLSTFDMFVLTLTANWEVGGSLAPGLTTVGRTIRDRIDLSRRVRALTTQSRVSVLGILGVTYFIAILMWRVDPDRMVDFLGTEFGRNAVGAALLLQAFGLFWITRMSEVKH